ncbi:hypothetical protein [Ruegeria sp. HKCCD6119]|uniref:hypothetical protein n=1 Tax=Ruegeria sp. HKCCD6119 TaxID=2683003 RepID=UPI0014925DD5|nr:hypothetical protein [Ruegeria sp. HKCCD6119]NOD83276.1 hypothetical protein [Ruegeria sp. HKCCD6119]
MGIAGFVKLAEKGFVGCATLAALLPLWQWYDETDERRVERLTGFIGAGDTCLKWLRSDLIESLASELWHASQQDVVDGDEDLAPLPVQVRANMAIFCAEMLDYLQNDFGKFDEPLAYDYYMMIMDASFWVDPDEFETYLEAVHQDPSLSGSHEDYSFGGRDGYSYEWQVTQEELDAYFGFEDSDG